MINKEFCKDTQKAIRNLIENWLLKLFSSQEGLWWFIIVEFVYSEFIFRVLLLLDGNILLFETTKTFKWVEFWLDKIFPTSK